MAFILSFDGREYAVDQDDADVLTNALTTAFWAAIEADEVFSGIDVRDVMDVWLLGKGVEQLQLDRQQARDVVRVLADEITKDRPGLQMLRDGIGSSLAE